MIRFGPQGHRSPDAASDSVGAAPSSPGARRSRLRAAMPMPPRSRPLRRCALIVAVAWAHAMADDPPAATLNAQTEPPFCRPAGSVDTTPETGGVLQVGGALAAVDIAGDLAFVAVGPRLAVYDIADAAVPRAVCTTAMFPDTVGEVAVADGRAYVLVHRYNGSETQLWVLDATEATALRVLGRVDLAGSFLRVAVGDGVAYLAGKWRVDEQRSRAGLVAVDVSDPRAPREIGRYSGDAEDGLWFESLVADGNRLIAGSFWGGLLVLDVSTPAQPRALGTLWAPDGPDGQESGVTQVALEGRFALVLVWNRLHVVDLADPAAPREVGRFPDLGVIGDIASEAGRAVMARDGGTGAVLDVTDPTAPRVVAELPHEGALDGPGFDDAMVLVGGRAAWVTFDGALRVADVRADALVSARVVPPLPIASHVVRVGRRAVVAGMRSGLWLVDLDGRTPPVAVPIPPSERTAALTIGTVAADGDTVFALDGWGSEGRLHVVDLRDPERPAWIGAVTLPLPADTGVPAYQMAAGGGFVYVPFGGHVSVVDVRDPAAPRVAGTVVLDGALATILHGRHVFVGVEPDSRLATVRTLDVTDPARPRVVGGISFNASRVAALAVTDDDRLFVVTGTRLYAFDVARPDAPRALRAFLPFMAASIVADGHRMVVDALDGVAVRDLSAFPDVREVWSVRLPGGIYLPNWPYVSHRAVLDGDRIVDARGDAGLFIVPPPPDQPPAGPSATPVAMPPDTARAVVYLPAALNAEGPRAGEATGCPPSHVALVLDTSDSEDPGRRAHPAAVASAAHAFVDAVDLGQTGVGLIGYDRQALRVVSGRDRDGLVAGLAFLAAPTRPGRRIDVGLAAAALDVSRTVGPTGRGEVVVVASGPPDAGTADLVRAAAGALRDAGWVVRSVAFGDDADAALMRELASGPGEARRAATGPELAALMDGWGRLRRDCGGRTAGGRPG